MKLKFFGTAAAEGLPALFCDCETCEKARRLGGKDVRTRSQSLVNNDLLIDFPADTYLHVLRDSLPLRKIYDCIITHGHSDHFYLSEFLMRGKIYSHLKDDRPFNVYGSSVIAERLKNNEGIMRMVDEGCFTINEVTPYEPFIAAGYKIIPLKADHDKTHWPLIYIIERNGKTIFYAHDTGIFPDETWTWLEKNKPRVDFATFDCTFGLRECKVNHMGFKNVLDVRKRLEDMKVLSENTVCCINHFSHNKLPMHEEIRSHAEKYGIITSYDGLEIEF